MWPTVEKWLQKCQFVLSRLMCHHFATCTLNLPSFPFIFFLLYTAFFCYSSGSPMPHKSG
jgi:hypothetical protein